jgi:hypothetical protein
MIYPDLATEYKIPESFYILCYVLELIIKIWQFGKTILNLVNLGHFFHGKSFVQVEIIFSRLKFGKFSPQKNTGQDSKTNWPSARAGTLNLITPCFLGGKTLSKFAQKPFTSLKKNHVLTKFHTTTNPAKRVKGREI